MLVVAFHAFPDRMPAGYIGVDVFFVISGYLISTIVLKGLADGSFRLGAFYGRRIRRIFTSLVVVLAASYAIGSVLLLPDEQQQLGKHMVGGAGFVSNFLLWGESDYFDKAAEFKPLLHLWSLGIEEQFYLVWPLVLMTAWRLGARPATAGVVILCGSFALNIALVGRDPAATFYSPLTRAWELMIGSLTAMAMLRRSQTLPAADGLALLGAAALVTSTALMDQTSRFPGWWALLPTLGTALLIAAGPRAAVNRLVLSRRALVAIGLISFPFYLWHWPLLSFARIASESGELSRHVRLSLVLGSLLLAVLTYWLLEQPMRTGGRGRLKVASLCTAMLLVGVVGYHAYVTGDLRAGYSPMARQLSTFSFEYKRAYRGGRCFLWATQGPDVFADECAGTGEVVLWGDSHAAHLYPGLSRVIPGVAQFTKAGCPPLMNSKEATSLHCDEVNSYVLNFMRRNPPSRVLLAGAWGVHDWPVLRETVQSLRQAGVQRIDLVGPFPEWTNGLPRTLITRLRRNAGAGVPQRLADGWNRSVVSLDGEMRELATQMGTQYISPVDILCNQGGCLTRVGEDALSLVAWDASHLTSDGSYYVASRFVN